MGHQIYQLVTSTGNGTCLIHLLNLLPADAHAHSSFVTFHLSYPYSSQGQSFIGNPPPSSDPGSCTPSVISHPVPQKFDFLATYFNLTDSFFPSFFFLRAGLDLFLTFIYNPQLSRRYFLT